MAPAIYSVTGACHENFQEMLLQRKRSWLALSAGDVPASPPILTHNRCARIAVCFQSDLYGVKVLQCISIVYFNKGKSSVALLLTICLTGIAHSEVLDAESNGFTVRHEVTIASDRLTVYKATASRIGEWWNADHTVSGNAANLYFDTRIPGCFCERLGDGAAWST